MGNQTSEPKSNFSLVPCDPKPISLMALQLFPEVVKQHLTYWLRNEEGNSDHPSCSCAPVGQRREVPGLAAAAAASFEGKK